MQRSHQTNTHTTHKFEGITRTIPKGKLVYDEGDVMTSIIFIHSGFIKLQTTETVRGVNGDSAGTTRLLEIMGPGDFLGFDDRTYTHHALAATEATITIIDRAHMNKPNINDALMQFYCRYARRQVQKAQAMEFNVVARMAFASRDLAERFSDATGFTPAIPLTHQEFADLIASSRVTVTKFSSLLHERGIMTPTLPRGHQVFTAVGTDEVIEEQLDEMLCQNDDVHKKVIIGGSSKTFGEGMREVAPGEV